MVVGPFTAPSSSSQNICFSFTNQHLSLSFSPNLTIKTMEVLEDQCKEKNTLFVFENLKAQNTLLLAQLQSLKQSNKNSELKRSETEEKLVNIQHELDDARRKNIELELVIEELSIQRNCVQSEFFAVEGRKDDLEENFSREFEVLRLIKECLMRVIVGLGEKELERREWEEWNGVKGLLEGLDFVLRMAKRVEENLSKNRGKDDFLKEIEDCKRKNKELMDDFSRDFEALGLVIESLMRISEGLECVVDDQCEEIMMEGLSSLEDGLERMKEMKPFSMKLDLVNKMVKRVEHRLNEYQEKAKKEKRELESSVMSLTEENRDINALLRISILEKEAVEKSLIKLKGENEQKRVPLLQFADWGLQRVGFGFIMQQEAAQKKDSDQCADNNACNSAGSSDISTESEDQEVVNLASAVETLMKNLRVEITQLRRALDDSRSDSERLQSLVEKQAQRITEHRVYIKQLEDRERTLTQNVEELLIEIKSTEDDVKRWREACELEVEAGGRVIQERDKVVTILVRELEQTKAALQVSNKKLKLKEELALAAMAAQSAAERSLCLADSRAAELRERIETLTRRLEQGEIWEKNNRSKVSRICWPWQAFKVARPANTNRARVRDIDARHTLPEMQTLLLSI